MTDDTMEQVKRLERARLAIEDIDNDGVAMALLAGALVERVIKDGSVGSAPGVKKFLAALTGGTVDFCLSERADEQQSDAEQCVTSTK
jgi:hypothetical protein